MQTQYEVKGKNVTESFHVDMDSKIVVVDDPADNFKVILDYKRVRSFAHFLLHRNNKIKLTKKMSYTIFVQYISFSEIPKELSGLILVQVARG